MTFERELSNALLAIKGGIFERCREEELEGSNIGKVVVLLRFELAHSVKRVTRETAVFIYLFFFFNIYNLFNGHILQMFAVNQKCSYQAVVSKTSGSRAKYGQDVT